MRDAEERGDEIIGVWHSHTHTDAYPSPTDVRQAVDPAWWYVIVSLKHGEPVLRAFQIRSETITEVPVEVGWPRMSCHTPGLGSSRRFPAPLPPLDSDVGGARCRSLRVTGLDARRVVAAHLLAGCPADARA